MDFKSIVFLINADVLQLFTRRDFTDKLPVKNCC